MSPFNYAKDDIAPSPIHPERKGEYRCTKRTVVSYRSEPPGLRCSEKANLENDDVRTSKWSRNWSLELKTEFILWHRISNSSYVIYVCVVTVNRVVLLLRSPWDLLAQVQNFHKNQESIGRKSHCT